MQEEGGRDDGIPSEGGGGGGGKKVRWREALWMGICRQSEENKTLGVNVLVRRWIFQENDFKGFGQPAEHKRG